MSNSLKSQEVRSLWITWETQRRNKELADAFNAKYLKLDFSSLSPLKRFFKSSYESIKEIRASSYQYIFTQYPSLYLCLLFAFISNFKKFTFVIDLHNAGVEVLEGESSFRKTLTSYALKQADFIIVSNSSLLERLKNYSCKFVVLPDRLTQIPKLAAPSFLNSNNFNITLISSFSDDEPIEDFIKGFLSAKSPKNSVLYITGKKQLANGLLSYESDKIKFTDFLPEQGYEALIQHSRLLVDLTTREDCLVCGAYEAISAEVPVLLSKTKVLEETFSKGTVFSENNSSSYSKELESFFKNESQLKNEISQMKKDFEKKWDIFFEEAKKAIFS